MTQHDGTPELGEPAALGDAADADLVLRSRSGDGAAFGELWRRHYRSGMTVARSVTSSLDPDDLVQEAYARIYQSILKGGGPTGSFRAYLFTSIRNTAAAWGRSLKETAIDELDMLEDPASGEQATSEALDRGLTHQAFRSLPARWQEVLWYSEIEQMKPAEIAPLLGMKPTAVAQLTFRAREGLREAWIQAHLRSVEDGSDCQWTIERLGAYARDNLGTRDRGKIEKHLSDCARCTIVAAEAKEVSDRLALVLLPLTVGIAGTAAYLASIQGGGAPIVALAAMPSSVVQGAVTVGPAAGATGAGATSGARGAAGAAGARAGGRIFGGIGATVGIAAAGMLVAGVVIAATIVPGMRAAEAGTPAAIAEQQSSSDAESDTETKIRTQIEPIVEVTPEPELVVPVVAPIDEPIPAPRAPTRPAPIAPAAPVAPVASVAPVAPVDPVVPVDPVDPTDPVDPVDPTDPTDPVLPEGVPTIGQATLTALGDAFLVEIAVVGTPGASVRALLDGVATDVVLDESGAGAFALDAELWQVILSSVDIGYVTETESGPLVSLALIDLVDFELPVLGPPPAP